MCSSDLRHTIAYAVYVMGLAGEQQPEMAQRILAQKGLDGMTLVAITAMLREANDLWAPALRLCPTLASTRELMSATIGQAVLMTGSGPTLVAVYPSEAAAARAAVMLGDSAAPELKGAAIISTSTMGRGADS